MKEPMYKVKYIDMMTMTRKAYIQAPSMQDAVAKAMRELGEVLSIKYIGG